MTMMTAIQEQLRRIESDRGVTILYAAESGSRAWGFASPDSDYDVRFIYVRPVRDYLRVDPPRDTIELPIVGDLDVNGWDIMKALALFRKSNPPLMEWLASPIVYRDERGFADRSREIAASQFSPRRMAYHYLHMACGNYRDYIEGRTDVRLKKYLYVLRPLACILWIERNGAPPPTAFAENLAGIDLADTVRTRIATLLAEKSKTGEMGLGPADPILNDFIVRERDRIETAVKSLRDPLFDSETINRASWSIFGL